MERGSSQTGAVLQELMRAAGLWRIWLRLGLQDVRFRYRRSGIGAAWVFLNLAITLFAVGYIYAHLLGQDLREFIPFLAVGLITWGYLTSSIVEGAQAFVVSEGYIKQISLPVYVYVFRFFVSIGLNAAIASLAFVAIALAYGVRAGPGTLWVVPGVLMLMAASFGFILILAHLHARFRDTAQLAGVAMQVGFYVTPVLFPATLLRGRGLNAIFDWNPLYHLLEVVRQPLLSAAPAAPANYAGCLIWLALLALFGVAVMARYRRGLVFTL
jgi:ABC-type polysaccharide/polyol phosphate export permease